MHREVCPTFVFQIWKFATLGSCKISCGLRDAHGKLSGSGFDILSCTSETAGLRSLATSMMLYLVFWRLELLLAWFTVVVTD